MDDLEPEFIRSVWDSLDHCHLVANLFISILVQSCQITCHWRLQRIIVLHLFIELVMNRRP
jgi:hypothetical protein